LQGSHHYLNVVGVTHPLGILGGLFVQSTCARSFEHELRLEYVLARRIQTDVLVDVELDSFMEDIVVEDDDTTCTNNDILTVWRKGKKE